MIEYGGWRQKNLKVDEYRPKSGFQGVEDDDEEDDEDSAGTGVAIQKAAVTDLEISPENVDTLTVEADGRAVDLSIISFTEKA